MRRTEKINSEYLALIYQFPLRPIRHDKDLRAASKIFSELGMRTAKLTRAERDYFDILGDIMRDYEEKSPRIRAFLKQASRISSQKILSSFMEDHNLSQSELARSVRIPQSVISEFLSGKRELSKKAILKLGNYFAVSPELFLVRY